MNSFLRRESRSVVAVAEKPRRKPRRQSKYGKGISSFPPLAEFIGVSQGHSLVQCLAGEEGEYFETMLLILADRIPNLPHTYQQDGKGDDAIVYLHYFKGCYDAYITEKDKGDPDEPGQHQAFGYASFGYGFEAGYISIVELLENNVELDLYFEPTTVGELKKAGKIKCD